MKETFYGNVEHTTLHDDVDRHVEEITLLGYTVVPDVFSSSELDGWRDKIDVVYAAQEGQFGKDALISIQELDICRAPLLYDFSFIELASHKKIIAIVERFLGDWFILNLQNAIINRPNTPHRQSAWHRDLLYQNFVISRPLAINALIAIDEFSAQTGGTHLLPFSHKQEALPSASYIDQHRVMANAPAGSAILFDAMLFHRAGTNNSSTTRRGVNHLYTTSIIKQQYDFPRALADKVPRDAALARLLGFTSQVPLDALSWRKARADRLQGT